MTKKPAGGDNSNAPSSDSPIPAAPRKIAPGRKRTTLSANYKPPIPPSKTFESAVTSSNPELLRTINYQQRGDEQRAAEKLGEMLENAPLECFTCQETIQGSRTQLIDVRLQLEYRGKAFDPVGTLGAYCEACTRKMQNPKLIGPVNTAPADADAWEEILPAEEFEIWQLDKQNFSQGQIAEKMHTSQSGVQRTLADIKQRRANYLRRKLRSTGGV